MSLLNITILLLHSARLFLPTSHTRRLPMPTFPIQFNCNPLIPAIRNIDKNQFANCLTAPELPTFLHLLLLTPVAVAVLILPHLRPLWYRAEQAYHLSYQSTKIREGWYDKRWSWVIVGGPIGRVFGGIILGWRELDRMDRAGEGFGYEGGVRAGRGDGMRVSWGIVIGIGIILALITAVRLRP